MKNYFENETLILPFSSVKFLSIELNKKRVKAFYGKGREQYYNFHITQLANYKAWLDAQANTSEIQTSSEKTVDKNFVYNKAVCEVCIWNHPTRSGYYNDKCMACRNYDNFKNTCSEKANDLEKFRNNPELVNIFNNLPTGKANDSDHPKNSALQMIKEMQVIKQSNGVEIPQIKWLIECWESVQGRKFESLTSDEIEDFLHDCLGILDYAGALNNINKGDLGNRLPDAGKTILTKEDVKKLNDQRIGSCSTCSNSDLDNTCLIGGKEVLVCCEYEPTDEFVKKINDLINEV